jgi:predicted acyl esterase
MDEAPVQLFIQNTGEWRQAYEWPLPETKWTEFYLHKDGLLSEHEIWPDETSTTFVDDKDAHGSVTFLTPPMVEHTEVCGPLALNLFARPPTPRCSGSPTSCRSTPRGTNGC